MMIKWIRLYLAILLLAGSTLPALLAHAEANEEPLHDEAKELVQKGLTIYEIDREVERLNEQETLIAGEIQTAEQNIEQQSARVDETRKHAARVLRAYYTGERDSIWLLIFSVSSLSDALKMFEYLQMIARNDHLALSRFTDSFQQLKFVKSKLEQAQSELQATKQNYLKQRERLVQLQAELDQELAVSAQAQVIQTQIQSVNEQWKQEGIPLFQKYLSSLSTAFYDLPSYVTQDKNGKYIDLSDVKHPVVSISDHDFNEYLHNKDELLKDLEFHFNENTITASGIKDQLQLVIQGSFSLIQSDAGNQVRFIVNRMEFNGFELPDTTIEDFMKQFQLGFVPNKLVPYLDVTGVETKEGVVVVNFKLNL